MGPLVIAAIVLDILFVLCLIILAIGRAKGYYPPKTCSICGRPTSLFRNRRYKLKDGCVCQQCLLSHFANTKLERGIRWMPSKTLMRNGLDTVSLVKQLFKMKIDMGDEAFWQQFGDL